MIDRGHLRLLWRNACQHWDLNRIGATSVYSPAELEADVHKWLVRIFGDDPPQFALPDPLRWWLEEVATTAWTDSATDPWRTFVASHGIIELSDEARWVDDPPECRTIYLALGRWSDRHYYLVNCSPESPEFGSISDYNDTHPWMNSQAKPDELWPDMTSFLTNKAE